jgi:hypothetical protein
MCKLGSWGVLSPLPFSGNKIIILALRKLTDWMKKKKKTYQSLYFRTENLSTWSKLLSLVSLRYVSRSAMDSSWVYLFMFCNCFSSCPLLYKIPCKFLAVVFYFEHGFILFCLFDIFKHMALLLKIWPWFKGRSAHCLRFLEGNVPGNRNVFVVHGELLIPHLL